MGFRVAAWAAAAAFVVVWLAILVAGLDPDVLCPDAPDGAGSSLSAQLTLWPPGGIECTYVSPGGASERTTHFPWDLWGSAALFAAGAACAATAPFRRRSRLLFAAAAAVLVPAAAAVWFL
ncbi:MAG TPA: hypothetical protein VH276_08580 [Solirubrobacteraceae bacterium]|jgi:hypothetical protein|nr:hypothetical protein [Solirubrobacteraceae bacterium]